MNYNPQTVLKSLRDAPRGAPFVVAQLGQSLDGRIATPTGKSKYISGKEALRHLHHLRAGVDAVIVGVNTVIVDDPLLTVRLVDGKSPIRVVIDPSGRTPTNRRLFGEAGPVLLIRADDAPESSSPCPTRSPDCEEIRLPRREDGVIPPTAIVEALHTRGIDKILIEGGARTLSHALQEGCVDLLHVTLSPVILGSGPQGLNLPPIDELDEAIRPAATVYAFSDGDALFCCELRARQATAASDASASLPTAAE